MGINIIIYHFIHLDLTADSRTVFSIMLLLIPISTIWFEYILLPLPCGLLGFLTIKGPICSQNICSVVECLALCRLWLCDAECIVMSIVTPDVTSFVMHRDISWRGHNILCITAPQSSWKSSKDKVHYRIVLFSFLFWLNSIKYQNRL